MRYPPTFLDEIRQRLPVSEVVGRRVKLRKQGREWAGLSPFNKEKTPSFFVNDQKGFYHCFSSGKHGDVFDFVMETEGLGFTDTVERLADLAGIALPKPTPGAFAREERRRELGDVVEAAAKFFEAELRGRDGGRARAYLAGRGLGPDTLEAFRIGYAPASRSALKKHLAGVGISVPEMIEAGLLVSGEDVGEPYDRFRDRIIFPIEDLRGRVVAFGGRALDPNVSAKYLNSPETPLFHKGRMLYNHHRARAAAHRSGTVVVVEGYVDAIAVSRSGIGHVVAPLGTALTEDQLDLLWRLGPEPILCFDGDGAGTRAAARAADLALPKLAAGRSLRFAFLPAGKDPDDLVRAEGAESLRRVLEAARPLAEVLIAREIDSAPIDTPERRAALEARFGEILARIGDANVRRHYRQAVDERLSALLGPPQLPARRRGRPGGRPFAARAAQPRPAEPSQSLRRSPLLARMRSPMPPREAALMLAVINHPHLLDQHCDEFGGLDFASADMDRLRRVALHEMAEGTADAESVRRAIVAQGLGDVLERLDAGVRGRREWWALAGAAEADALTGFRHALALHVKVSALHNELRSAEAALGQEPSEDNFRRVVEVQRGLRAVEGSEAAIDGFGGASGRPVRSL